MMRKTLLAKFLFFAIISGFLLAGEICARQTQSPLVKRNSPYSPNPKRKTEPAGGGAAQKQATSEIKNPQNNEKIVNSEGPDKTTNPKKVAKAEIPQTGNTARPDAEKVNFQNADFESRSVAKKTLEVAKRAAPPEALLPTEIYKVGVGDILFISLQNAPAKESTFFTVLKDGTIDYPLAGEMVSVLGLTTEEIQSVLQEKIKLYESPQVLVKIREHNSHTYTVLGMVDRAGEKPMQREAIPLFVVRAEAIVQAKSDRAVIKRANSQTETVDLRDKKYEEVLIFPGDIIEFDSAENGNAFAGQPQFYYIGGQIVSGGQKDFYKGITLTQAIIASGGLKKSSVKNVTIRRKNEAGLLVPFSFDLKAIKEGKFADPVLEAGDTVEIGN